MTRPLAASGCNSAIPGGGGLLKRLAVQPAGMSAFNFFESIIAL